MKLTRYIPEPLIVLWPCALILVVALSACTWIPSALRIGGTPMAKLEKAEAKQAAAAVVAVAAAQSSVHQAGLALGTAGDSRPVQVARDFVNEAQALLDQSQGAPTANEIAKWEKLVAGLVSENEAVRAAAEREREANRRDVAKISARLSTAAAQSDEWRVKAMTYAADADQKADLVRKLVFWCGLVVGLWLLAQLLRVGAFFVPALAPAATLLGSVAAPAVQFAASRAQQGLQLVGTAIGTIRKEAPALAEKVTGYFDDKVEHPALRKTIREAAEQIAPTTIVSS